ncbi:MAG TPA: serine/threonine-protein kinase [Acidimicrobiales bacterium]
MNSDYELLVEALPAYDVGGELGRGAWGRVFAGRHRHLDRNVAIKQLPPAFGADPTIRARFLAEARLLASLDHPHIVPIYDYVEFRGLCVLVMERLSLGTVVQRAQMNGFTQPASVAIGLATAAGLHHAHQRGVLHRDVKPQNLMFSSTSTVKVTDFGIAKVIGGANTVATRAGYVMGTPAYIAPEQAQAKQLTPATDVYAAATVVYELLSGRLPYSDEGDAVTMLYRHVHEDPEPLGAANPDVPGQLAGAVDRALVRDPRDRYASAEEFGIAIARAASSSWGPSWLDTSGITVVVARSMLAEVAGSSPAEAAPETRRKLGAITVLNRRPARRESRQPVDVALTDLVPAGELIADRARPGRRISRWQVIGAVTTVAIGALVVALVVVGRTDRPSRTAQTHTASIIFSDNFTDRNSGWGTLNSPAEVTQYTTDHHYRIDARVPEQVVYVDSEFSGGAVRPQLTDIGDASVEVGARQVSGGQGVFGLLCRGRGLGQPYYFGAAGTDGFWGLYKYTYDTQGTGDATTLNKGDIPSLATPPGATPRLDRLRLDCAGRAGATVTLRLYENGVLVGEAQDPNGLPTGRVGMLVDSESSGDLAVDFDSFTVRRLVSG